MQALEGYIVKHIFPQGSMNDLALTFNSNSATVTKLKVKNLPVTHTHTHTKKTGHLHLESRILGYLVGFISHHFYSFGSKWLKRCECRQWPIQNITLISSPLDVNRNSRNFVEQVARDEMGRTEEFNPVRDLKQDISKNPLQFCTCMHW